jgi:hypothetical protein
MKRTFLVTLGLVALVILSLAFTSGQNGQFKNLKVLPKNITKPELDSVMKNFTTSLNVKCNFCHVKFEGTDEWNFPSDANKHKLITRDMMKMTTKINKKFFDYTAGKRTEALPMVTCYTCHNGRKEPLAFAPVDTTRRQQK